MAHNAISGAFYDRLTAHFNVNNIPLLASAGCAFVMGYLQYVYAIGLMLTHGRGPIPVWMHFFYLAHDSTFSTTLSRAATRYHTHFYLHDCSLAYGLWSALEIYCIYYSMKYSGRLNFGPALGARSASLRVVLRYTIFTVGAMYCIVNLVVQLIGGPGCIMQWGCLTSVRMVVGPTHDFIRRGSRDGLTVGFCVVDEAKPAKANGNQGLYDPAKTK